MWLWPNFKRGSTCDVCVVLCHVMEPDDGSRAIGHTDLKDNTSPVEAYAYASTSTNTYRGGVVQCLHGHGGSGESWQVALFVAAYSCRLMYKKLSERKAYRHKAPRF